MDKSIAQTIADLIGNATFRMLGAERAVGLSNGLKFRIQGCKSINSISIIYVPGYDTYSMEFWKITHESTRLVSTFDNVYADHIHSMIESETGLRTQPPVFCAAE